MGDITMKKRMITLLLAVLMMLSVMTMPAAAKASDNELKPTANTVIIKRNGYQGKSYNTYSTQKKADLHAITIYAAADNFPIEVAIAAPETYYNPKNYTLTTYGIHRVKSRDTGFFFSNCNYATISVQAPPKETPETVVTRQPTAEEILDQKWKTLLDQIDFPFYYREYSDYAKEVKAFLAGEWDGSDRVDDGDGWGSYTASRYVMSRTYHWIASDLITGESYNLSANVDYAGYKEVIPGYIPSQKYSLAVSYVDGVIEQWSTFDMLDSWKIDAVANRSETINYIIPLATESSGEDDAKVIMQTTDADGKTHHYSLMPKGEIIRK